MALQGDRGDITFPVTTGIITANKIVAMDSANPGNVKISTAALAGGFGVTTGPADTKGYAVVRTRGIAQITVGTGGVTAGDHIASDASGQAVTQALAASGSTVKQIIGKALNTAAAGALVDVLIGCELTVG